MINKSIAYRLSIFISLAVISVFIAFIIVSFIFNQKLLKENTENKAIGISTEIIMEVEKLAVSTREITSNISNQILFYGKLDEADILINGIMKKYDFLNAIHINIDTLVTNLKFHNYNATRVGDSIIFKSENRISYFCKNEKEFTKQILQTKQPGWTEPFRCPDNNDVVVSYFSPVKILINGEEIIIGEVISELSLLDLNDVINSKEIEDGGFAFLISEKGDYITHPKKEWILNRNIFTISDKVIDKKEINIEEIFNKGQSGTTVSYPEFFNYKKSWVYYSRIDENGWWLIFNLPYDKLFEPLYMLMLRMLFFSVVGILIIFLTITFITNKLVEPLSTVTSQLKKFSNLSGNEVVGETMDEVKLVSESLDYLQSWYENYQVSQKQEKKKSTRRMEDLLQASEIQRSLIKTDFPALPERKEIDLFGIYKPANIVSGDLFDYFFIDDENLVFTIGDVSGKGIPAAIFMSVSQTIIKGSTTVKMARNIVSKANKELYTNNRHQFFLTLFLGVLNVKTGILNYCNAAHTSTIILKWNGEIQELNESHGLPLGLYPEKEYSDSKIKIEKGDTLFLFTDGISELQNYAENFYGIERFKETIKMHSNNSLSEMADKILKSLDEFRGEIKQVDDISLLILRYNP